jgi:hypothetical protein
MVEHSQRTVDTVTRFQSEVATRVATWSRVSPFRPRCHEPFF